MNGITRWSMLLAAGTGAAIGFMLAQSRGRDRRHRKVLHAVAVHDWEGEGGNLAPTPATSLIPPPGTPV